MRVRVVGAARRLSVCANASAIKPWLNIAALPDSPGEPDSATCREHSASVQESGRHAHHERVLSSASGGMEHRRSCGRARGVLRGKEARPTRGASEGGIAEGISGAAHRSRCAIILAEVKAALGFPGFGGVWRRQNDLASALTSRPVSLLFRAFN